MVAGFRGFEGQVSQGLWRVIVVLSKLIQFGFSK